MSEQAQLEFGTGAEIQAARNRLLRQVLDSAAASSSFYQAKFRSLGVHPGTLTTEEELRRVPVTTTEEVESDPLGFLFSPMFRVIRVATTSGTTGKPKIVFFPKPTDTAPATLLRIDRAAGLKPGDRLALLAQANSGMMFVAQRRWNDRGIDVLYMEPELVRSRPAAVLEILKKWDATAVRGRPSYLFYLAQWARRAGVDLGSALRVRRLLVQGQSLPRNMKAYIVQHWGAEVFEEYGASELGTLAYECEAHDGLHIQADRVIVEVLAPDRDEPAEEGQVGRAVFTTLSKGLSVFVRYDLGDLVKYSSYPCACGRSFPRLWHQGRIREVVSLRNGARLYPHQIYDLLERFPDASGRFRLSAGHQDSHDSLFFLIEVLETEKLLNERLRGEIEQAITGLLSQTVQCPDAKVRVQLSDPLALLENLGRQPQALFLDSVDAQN